MALRRTKTQKAQDAIMRGVIEIGAFQHMTCVGIDPIDDTKGCADEILLIVVALAGKDDIACGGYCLNHMFLLEPYVAASKQNIGLEEDT